jgi:DNA-binding CsgD family transcriptional regulator
MLEELIRSIGTERFGSTAFALLRKEIAIQHLTINRYAEYRPVELIAVECARGAHSFHSAINHYVRGSYISDPLRPHYHGTENAGYDLFSVSSEQVRDRQARQKLYSSTGIAAKLALIVHRQHDVLTLAIYRSRDDGDFKLRDLKLMRSLSGDLAAAVERHVALSSSAKLNCLDELTKLLVEIPCGALLSRQEVAVCARIIAGYSTESIALNLGVSPHSVATYRLRAYAKLNISSQNELFLLVLGLCTRRAKAVPQIDLRFGAAVSTQKH